MTSSKTWRAQERQDKVKVEIIVNGNPDWRELFRDKLVALTPPWSEWCGGNEVPVLDYLRKEAEVNDVSFERCVLNTLLNQGYILEELEVEFFDGPRAAWGRCSWYSEHPAYTGPSWSKGLQEMFPKANERDRSFIIAMFNTEHSGDQQFTLLSMQMIGAALMGQPPQVLLHKTLVYRRAVLSTPKAAEQEAA